MTDPTVTGRDASFSARFLTGSQLAGYGRFADADRAYGEAGAAAGLPDEVATAAAVRASNRFWQLADLAGAHEVLDDAARRIGDGPAGDSLLVMRALLLFYEGRTARSLVISRGVRRRGRTSPAALLLGAAVEAASAGVRGRVGDLPASGPPAGAPDEALLDFGHGVLCCTTGLARTINGLDPAVDARGAPGAPAHAAMAAGCEGTAGLVEGSNLLWAGRAAAACDVLERAAAHLRRSDRLHTEAVALGQLAYGRALLGDAAGAARAAEEAGRARHAIGRFETFFVARGRAWAVAVAGELTAPRERLVAAAGECERHGQPVLAAQAWYDVARLGDPEVAAPALARLGRRAHGSGDALTPVLAAHVGALAAGDAPGVGRAAVRLRQRGHLLHAAEAAAQAALLHGRARLAEADRWAGVARELIDGCEGARTPALTGLAQLELTRREREVIGLVARGLSNPEIARRLHLSVRTVENHVQSGYGKLGIHRRAELAHLHPFGGNDLTAWSVPSDGE